MKKTRQQKILEIIAEQSIGTQEELAQALKEEGYEVAQATVSRDIRALRLTKVAGPSGELRYTSIRDSQGDGMEDTYIDVLRSGFVSMRPAANLIVIRTFSGMAMAVAAALDNLSVPEILGCIAGDDTIMAATESAKAAEDAMRRIRSMIENR